MIELILMQLDNKHYPQLRKIFSNELEKGQFDGFAVVSHYFNNLLTPENNVYKKDALKILQKKSLTNSYLKNIAKPKKKSDFTFVDLFAGIGGMRLAFEKKGGRCTYSSEWDRHARITYEKNFGEVPFGDITDDLIKKFIPPNFDVLLAGFPCQPFSNIGKREGFKHPTQGTLFHEILHILKKHKPPSFLLENVPGLMSHDGGNTYKIMKEELNNANYEVHTFILDSYDFGVPQRRKRLYMIGFYRSKIKSYEKFEINEFPKKTIGVGSILEKDVDGYSITEHLQGAYMHKSKDGKPFIVDRRWTKTPATTLVSTYHKIQRLTGTFVSGGKTGMRLLTINECKKLMGFPNSFEFPVSRTQAYRQLGNAVVVPVVESIALSIKEKLHELN